MRWISNNDPPLYVRAADEWYNQKDKKIYSADLNYRLWETKDNKIDFPKKTVVIDEIKSN